jgi:hypothetical protein
MAQYTVTSSDMIGKWLEKRGRKFVELMLTFVCGSTVTMLIMYRHTTRKG